MATETLTYSGTLVVEICWCGIRHSIPWELARQAEHNGRTVYCPLGHQWVVKKTEAERLAERLQEEQNRSARLWQQHQATRDLLRQEERSHAATKGHVTRARKRAAAGTCPCCKRTFQQVSAHMQRMHPEYVEAAR